MQHMGRLLIALLGAWVFIAYSSCTQSTSSTSTGDTPGDSTTDSSTKIEDLKDEVDVSTHAYTQSEMDTPMLDNQVVRKIFDEALLNGQCYENLKDLTEKIGGRLSGSPEAAQAVEWAYQTMDNMKLERVWKQEVMVPKWTRGAKEIGQAKIPGKESPINLSVCALGGSIPTVKQGLTAPVIEVEYFNELEKLGKENVEGKIVFFNRKMDPRFINTFYAYGNCVEARWGGASKASKYGALGVVVRSMTLSMDDSPHTGSMGYEDGTTPIPAMAISTMGAEKLSKLIKENEDAMFYMQQSCTTEADVLSHNVVGEIRGSEFPDEIIIVGGHLDSWDLGDGAHDDGAGCVQSMEVLRILKAMGVKPKRTIRAVMFMNEENGLKGALKYAELAKKNNENHIAAVETDRGGFAPQYFSFQGTEDQGELLKSWLPMLDEYNIRDFKEGGAGADIGPLKDQGTLLIGLVPESQRYFDYHHCDRDKIDAVNKRELEMGSAAMAALVYLLSEHGVEEKATKA